MASQPLPPLHTALQQLISSVTPLFKAEGPQYYHAAMAHNAQFAQPAAGVRPYQTDLRPADELAFRGWLKQHNVPFDPNARIADYDMRGFWKGGGRNAAPNGHFPDTYKTPYDTTFSGESKYAVSGTPFKWQGNTLVDSRNGQVVFKGGG